MCVVEYARSGFRMQWSTHAAEDEHADSWPPKHFPQVGLGLHSSPRARTGAALHACKSSRMRAQQSMYAGGRRGDAAWRDLFMLGSNGIFVLLFFFSFSSFGQRTKSPRTGKIWLIEKDRMRKPLRIPWPPRSFMVNGVICYRFEMWSLGELRMLFCR